MKIVVQVMVCLVAMNCFAGCAFKTTKPVAKERAPLIKNEPDQTDVFAIPLDSSEEEENQEYKMLQSIGEKKQEQAKKKQLEKKQAEQKALKESSKEG
ncbi:MAG: hypothetical protein JWO53_515 [Chlamydiia bacterium]|nr:hypothetical protein [Chlamydiia bacterium]